MGTISKFRTSFRPLACVFPLSLLLFLILTIAPFFGVEAGRCPDSLPPPPKPQRRAGGESLAPLPLPVTPQRRTEKKRPPRPPILIGKVAYGNQRDWEINSNDANSILHWFEAEAGFRFGWRMVRLRRFSFNPADIPILYVSGYTPFRLTEHQIAQLREYLIKGGSLIITSCCDSKPFQEAARRDIAKLFPGKRLNLLGIDNPIYRCFYNMTNIAQTRTAVTKSLIEAIDIGWRTAIIYSEYDLGRGWIPQTHLKTCPAYKMDDKPWMRKLGINMLTYVLANRKMAPASADSIVYTARNKLKGSSFTIAQVIHAGQWNPDPSAISALLKDVKETTAVPVSFRIEDIKLTDPTLFSHPFLYMTGHNNFKFSENEVKDLRFYLLNGGFLLADSADGREVFNAAFRREIKRVLPELPLSPIPLDNPLYSAYYKIKKVTYSAAIRVKDSNLTTPRLQGITINGNLAVVYSPYDLRYGWNFNGHPYRRGYSAEDSRRLGVNIIVYALTH